MENLMFKYCTSFHNNYEEFTSTLYEKKQFYK